jgi:hypothetical protein
MKSFLNCFVMLISIFSFFGCSSMPSHNEVAGKDIKPASRTVAAEGDINPNGPPIDHKLLYLFHSTCTRYHNAGGTGQSDCLMRAVEETLAGIDFNSEAGKLAIVAICKPFSDYREEGAACSREIESGLKDLGK